MTTEHRTRGRPRTPGTLHCDRCGGLVAKIRVHWPDGAICGICFTTATHTRGPCATCGDTRLLPGKDADGSNICRDCAGITTLLHCDNCGDEAERFRNGNCIRCVLRADLTATLQPNTPPDLRLKRLVAVFANAERPESIYTWKRGIGASALLTRLGTRELAISHEAFDALPASNAVEHLRETLTHHGMLPPRDRQLAAFERWLEERIVSLADHREIQGPIERFGRWHHLKRLRAKSLPGKNMNFAVRSAKQEITESGRFLAWLLSEHDTTYTDIRQSHLDDYLASGPSTRHAINTFIASLVTSREIAKVRVPRREARSTPILTQAARIDHIRACLTAGEMPAADRVAALILLLYAHPVGKIAALKTSALEAQPDGLYLRLGSVPALLPAQVAATFWDYVHNRPNQQTVNTDSPWLFPGNLPGQHTHPETMLNRLRNWGIDLNGVRNTALRDLAKELNPTALANSLGYSSKIIHQHAAAGAPHADYINLKSSQLRPSPRLSSVKD